MRRLHVSRFIWIGTICCLFFALCARFVYATQVSNVQISNIGEDSAQISWSTDIESDSMVNYGLDDNFGVARTGTLQKTHTITLNNLEPATTYYFRVVSADDQGNTNATAGFQLTTKGTPDVKKVIKEIKELPPEDLQQVLQQPEVKPPAVIGTPKVEPNESGATVTWTTDRDADSQVLLEPESSFNANAKNPYSIEQGNPKEESTKHVVNVIGLDPATVYHFIVSSTDSGNLTGVSEDDTFETKATVPIVQNIKVTGVNETSAIISWTTPVPAKGVVSYTNLRTKAVKSAGSPIYVSNQKIQLTGLEFGTKYNAIITATNQAGDNYDSKQFSFLTTRDVVPPVISKVANESTLFPGDDAKVQTIISWTTDEPADCQVFYTQGLVHDAGTQSDSLPKENDPLENHTQVIVGFSPGTVYKFWLVCDDIAGNEAQSEDYVLITPVKEKNIIDIILENFQGTFGWVNKVGK